MLVLTLDGALFKLSVKTPAFAPLFQLPPRMKATPLHLLSHKTFLLLKLMSKTYKNLFPKIVDAKNLLNAFRNASQEKRFRSTVLNFEKNLAHNILQLRQELITKKYQHGKYHFFRLFDPKERKISAAPFRDRIVHHAVYQILEPIFNKQ